MTNRCLICEREIQTDAISVCGATVWHSPGNYGSAVYDPIDGSTFLEAYVCDDCLQRKKGLVQEVVVERTEKVVARRPPVFEGVDDRMGRNKTRSNGADNSRRPGRPKTRRRSAERPDSRAASTAMHNLTS